MPGAWEILEERERRILLAVLEPPRSQVTFAWAAALKNLNLPPGSNIMPVVGLPYGPARNRALKSAYDWGYGWCGFLDSDVVVRPDAFLTLQACGLPLISGAYMRRQAPHVITAWNVSEKDGKKGMVSLPFDSYPPGSLVPADYLPGGLLLIRRDLMTAMLGAHPKPFEWTHDIDIDEEKGDQGYSEDYMFSSRAKSLGYQGFLHTGVFGQHETQVRIKHDGTYDDLPMQTS